MRVSGAWRICSAEAWGLLVKSMLASKAVKHRARTAATSCGRIVRICMDLPPVLKMVFRCFVFTIASPKKDCKQAEQKRDIYRKIAATFFNIKNKMKKHLNSYNKIQKKTRFKMLKIIFLTKSY